MNSNPYATALFHGANEQYFHAVASADLPTGNPVFQLRPLPGGNNVQQYAIVDRSVPVNQANGVIAGQLNLTYPTVVQDFQSLIVGYNNNRLVYNPLYQGLSS